jgi:hypothetical protein
MWADSEATITAYDASAKWLWYEDEETRAKVAGEFSW